MNDIETTRAEQLNYYRDEQRFLSENWNKPDLFIRMLKFRREHNKDSVVVTCGERRSGKSYDDMKISEEVNKPGDWKVEENCFFDIPPFLRANKEAYDRTFQIEETSINLSNREWFDRGNRVMNNFVTAQGFRRNILFMNLPTIKHMDPRTTDLVTYVMHTLRVGLVRVYRVKVQHHLGKVWLQPFCNLELGLPSKDNIEKYEEMKKKWNEDNLKNDIEELERPKKERHISPAELKSKFKAGVIDRDFAIDELMRQGYSFSRADIFMQCEESL